jgi:hypothetical protein
MDMDVGQHGSREAQSAVCFHGGCGSSLSQTVSSMTPFLFALRGLCDDRQRGKTGKKRQKETEGKGDGKEKEKG